MSNLNEFLDVIPECGAFITIMTKVSVISALSSSFSGGEFAFLRVVMRLAFNASPSTFVLFNHRAFFNGGIPPWLSSYLSMWRTLHLRGKGVSTIPFMKGCLLEPKSIVDVLAILDVHWLVPCSIVSE